MAVFATTHLGHGTLLNKIISLSRSAVIFGKKMKCGKGRCGGRGRILIRMMMEMVAQFSLAGVALFGLALKGNNFGSLNKPPFETPAGYPFGNGTEVLF
jgi:hypothetical protein